MSPLQTDQSLRPHFCDIAVFDGNPLQSAAFLINNFDCFCRNFPRCRKTVSSGTAGISLVSPVGHAWPSAARYYSPAPLPTPALPATSPCFPGRLTREPYNSGLFYRLFLSGTPVSWNLHPISSRSDRTSIGPAAYGSPFLCRSDMSYFDHGGVPTGYDIVMITMYSPASALPVINFARGATVTRDSPTPRLPAFFTGFLPFLSPLLGRVG